MNMCYDVNSTSVKHSNLGFRLWSREVCIVCSHVNSCRRKNELLGILKGNMDLHKKHVFVWFLHKKHVQARTRVFHSTFQYLCEKLGQHLIKQHTFMKNSISMKNRFHVFVWGTSKTSPNYCYFNFL